MVRDCVLDAPAISGRIIPHVPCLSCFRYLVFWASNGLVSTFNDRNAVNLSTPNCWHANISLDPPRTCPVSFEIRRNLIIHWRLYILGRRSILPKEPRPVDVGWLTGDVIAGLTVGMVLVPQSMSYATVN
jgi:hypothetical protein